MHHAGVTFHSWIFISWRKEFVFNRLQLMVYFLVKYKYFVFSIYSNEWRS